MYCVIARAEVLEVAVALARGGHDLVGLVDHLQGVVIAHRDALGAPLALAGVDDDVEHPPGQPLLLGGVEVLLGSRPLGAEHLAVSRFGDRRQPLLELGLGEHLAQDRRVGALGHAVHAAGAVLGNIQGDLGGDVAEVAEGRRAGGNQRAGQREIGGQPFLGRAVLVTANDPFVEVEDIEDRQADELVGGVDQGAVAAVVERVLVVRFVHRGFGSRLEHRSFLERDCVHG